MLHIPFSLYYTQNPILWTASHNGALQSVERIVSTKKANLNWNNPLMLVSYDYSTFIGTITGS